MGKTKVSWSAHSLFTLTGCFVVVNMEIAECRADKHMPSYAKKIVAMYNRNGEIDQMLSNR